LQIFRFEKAFAIARNVKAFLNPEDGNTPSALPAVERHEDPKAAQLRASEHKKRLRSEIKSKRQELSQIKEKAHAAKEWAERIEHNKRKKGIQQEIFRLERELRAAKVGGDKDTLAGRHSAPAAEGEEPQTGALPDFVIIGTQKGGTTFLYHLLTQHPLVEPAASKESHFFDLFFDEGVEWYRRFFPAPRWEDDRRTITGEASPYYLFHPYAAERMAKVVPKARLIALLRNPVDRAYSLYQQQVRKGHETLKFEDAIESEEARLRGERDRMLEDEHLASFEHQHFSYLSRGIYVDQLLRWSRFFDREQLLVLKSEDFFENPIETLQVVLEFLGLPGWKPEVSGLENKRNAGEYERGMNPSTRRRLEEYFEPHNRRLYDHLGVDLGW
jgi:hypothetical protein